MKKITPFLWFDGNAEEAARFHVSVFPNAKMGRVPRPRDAGGPRIPPCAGWRDRVPC